MSIQSKIAGITLKTPLPRHGAAAFALVVYFLFEFVPAAAAV